jgi:hypothetical protein
VGMAASWISSVEKPDTDVGITIGKKIANTKVHRIPKANLLRTRKAIASTLVGSKKYLKKKYSKGAIAPFRNMSLNANQASSGTAGNS